MDNFVWPAKTIEKISLLPDWNREHYYTLMYIRDLAKEVSGLSPSGAVSSDVAWTSFSEQVHSDQFCHGFVPVSPCLGCSKCQRTGFPVLHSSMVAQHMEQKEEQPLCSPGAQATVSHTKPLLVFQEANPFSLFICLHPQVWSALAFALPPILEALLT